jgi:hypothetical protein
MLGYTSNLLNRRSSLPGSVRAARAVLFTIFLLVFALASLPAHANNATNIPRPSVVGPGSQFAIADFDGDLHPDLASIDSSATVSGSANYRIQLRLSSAGPQSIQLVAPGGGLVIEARDVNGDDAVDLVLATAWRRQPVAILLNDGHGGFTRAEPDAFPAAFTHWPTNSYSAAIQSIEAFGLLPGSRTGLSAPSSISFDCAVERELAFPAHSTFSPSTIVVPHAGRAPPSPIL